MLLLCNYYLTYRCNADCEFCHFGYSTELNKSNFANLDDVLTNLIQLRKLGVKFIDFTGGEPLLYKNIDTVLRKSKELNFQTSITTNCFLYPNYAQKIKGNVDLLHFSLDSPNKDKHDKLRKLKCYDKVIESIDIAKSIGEKPDIIFTVTNENYSELDEMYEFTTKHKTILLLNPVFSYFGNEGLSQSAINYIKKFIKNKSSVYINTSFLRLREQGGNHITHPKCKAVSRVIVISPDNEILLPCYHFANKQIKIDRPIKELRKSEEIKYYKKMEGRFEFCEGCTINCYFEPSFALPLNIDSLLSYKSKFKYAYHKIIKQKFLKL